MTGNAPTHTCSYFCDKPECIKAQRDELRDKLAALESQPVTVEPECITKMRRLPKGAAYEVEHKTLDYIDTLQSALRVERATVETLTKTVEAFQSELKRVTVEPECPPDGWPINPHVRAWRIYAYALQSALQRAQEERDDAYEVADSESKGVWSETLLRYAKFNGEHLAVCFERNEYRERANKAESLNRRMVELLKEIQGHVDFDDGEGNNDSSILRGRLSMIGDCVKAMSEQLLKEAKNALDC